MTVLVVVMACLAGGAVLGLIAIVGSKSSRAADRYRNDSGSSGGHSDGWSGSSCSSDSSCSSSSCGSGCGGGGGGD